MNKNKQDITKIKKEMVGYKYKHYKNGKIYLVLDIVIHTETQELMVVYRNINDEQIWCRPLSIFNEEIDNEHHKRFEKIDDDSVIDDVSCSKYPLKNYKIKFKEQQEQAILKEFEEDGWDIEKDEETGIIIFDNGDVRVKFYTFEEVYECVHFTLNPAMVDAELHLRIHKLLGIWGWFDENS